jgi:hypothetical protein
VKERQAAEAAAAENEAKARRQAAENLAKAKMDKDKADAQAKENQAEKEKEEAAAKARREAKEAESAKKGQTSTEWRKWVEKQKWMKAQVIEVVKADKATKSALRVGMRLITRNLGQVTNTRDVVVRVVSQEKYPRDGMLMVDKRHPQDPGRATSASSLSILSGGARPIYAETLRLPPLASLQSDYQAGGERSFSES